MSMSLMVQAMKARVGNALRKLVLNKLADNASDSGECWPSVPTIAYECEISERSVQNHIKQLVADGFVRIEERYGENGVNRSNIYHLSFNSDGANSAPYQNKAPADGANPAPYGASPAPHGANAAGGMVQELHPEPISLEPVIESKDPPLNPPRGNGRNKFDPLSAELPDWLDPELWVEWVKYRRQLKQPIKTAQGVAGLINKLARFRKQGYSPDIVIREAMANEWRGLFEPKSGCGSAGRYGRDINQVSQPGNVIPPGFRG